MTGDSALTIVGVPGIGVVVPGDDLADMLSAALAALTFPDGNRGRRDGDVVAVSSKVVANAEGRVRAAPDRESAIDTESVAELARRDHPRGTTRIVRTSHGFVLAAAGVDASNTDEGTVVLLPERPDYSAAALRAELLRRHGLTNIGVLITDTAGRPWREGVVDFAVGSAGIVPLDDLRGRPDAYGASLDATIVAIGDQLAAASELVRPKAGMVAAAVIRGADRWVRATSDDASALIRPPAADLFTLGTAVTKSRAVLAPSGIASSGMSSGSSFSRNCFTKASSASSAASGPCQRATIARPSSALACRGCRLPSARPETRASASVGARPEASRKYSGIASSGMLMTLPNMSAGSNVKPMSLP